MTLNANSVRRGVLAALVSCLAAVAFVGSASADAGTGSSICLLSSVGAPRVGASTQYYQNGWKSYGATGGDGCAHGATLAGNLPVGITYGGVFRQENHDFTASSSETFQTVATTVKLIDSVGAGIAGGSAQYYANGWHQLGTTDASGAVTTELLSGSTPFGMTAGGIYNQKSQDPSVTPVVVFQTVATTVKLIDSTGAGTAGGSAQYYANGWHQLGTTDAGGTVTTELLPGSTPFGMTSGGVYNQKSQDPSVTPVVVFQTVATTVKLIDSAGAGIAGGSAQYYANGWHQLGTTDASGAVTTELLPGSTPFGMTSGGIYNQKSQDPSVTPVVVFQTVATTVKLIDSTGAGIAGGSAQYYANGWHQLGTTDASGNVTTELLPGSTPFGMTSGGIYNQKSQDPSVTPVVVFQTVATTVKLIDSTGAGIAGGGAQYYANGWHQLGTTDAGGNVTTELLPGSTPFGMTSGGIYNQKSQDPSVTPVVVFQTVHVIVSVKGSNGGPVAGATTNYYGNGWRSIGTTGNDGTTSIELLPASTPFNAASGSASVQVTQSTGDNAAVVITLAVTRAPVPAAASTLPSVTVEFVSATDTTVTWRVTPASPATLYYWDAVATCTVMGAADCQQMAAGGHGKTTASGGAGQGFLVTQNFTKDGDSCHVTNEVTYGPREDKTGAKTASATYECSGMPALGWPGLGMLFALGLVGATVVWQRSRAAD